MCASDVQMPGIESCLMSSGQLLTKAPGEAADEGPNTWLPVSHGGELFGVPDSWLQPGPAPDVVGICGMNQQLETLLFSISLLSDDINQETIWIV